MNEAEFDARLRGHTPRAWAMPLVMLACLAMWAANVASGMDFMKPTAEELYRWGASSASGVQSGEGWRLVTAMFLHGGVMHLALNMFALWEAGLTVTRLFGNRGFLLIYFGTGLAGGALSLHFAGQQYVSVGASGAVFGVIGALLASVIEHRGRFPAGRGRQLIASLLFFVLFSLASGFAQTGIDNAAHVGGLVSGLVAGWLLVEKIEEGPSRAQRTVRFLLTAALLAGGAWAIASAAPPARRDIAGYFSNFAEWRSAEAAMTASLRAMEADGNALRGGTMTEAVYIQRLGTVHRPAMSGVSRRLDTVRLPADEPSGKFVAVQRRFARAYLELIDNDLRIARGDLQGTAEARQRLRKQLSDAAAEIAVLNQSARAQPGAD